MKKIAQSFNLSPTEAQRPQRRKLDKKNRPCYLGTHATKKEANRKFTDEVIAERKASEVEKKQLKN